MRQGELGFGGALQTKVIRGNRKRSVVAICLQRLSNARHALIDGAPVLYAELKARHYIAAENRWKDLGVVSRKAVTTEFVNLLVDELQASAPTHTRFFDFKFHDCGTGTTAENASDVALVTPYGGARTSGTQVEGASANIYRSIGTIAFTSTLAITEHGLFNAASATDELMDRSVFTAINVVNGDSIQFTYELTCTAGG